MKRNGARSAAALFLLAAQCSLVGCQTNKGDEPLPVLERVPDFRLVSSNEESISGASFAGKIWVADFIFTRCSGVCPILSARMARIQNALALDEEDLVHLVSFSVDPNHDTPEVLRAYADRFGAQEGRWTFVTGDRTSLHNLIRDGFRLAVAERAAGEVQDSDELITHSDRFVLVDRDLRIRAYYRGTEAETVDQILRDIARLRAESAS